MTNNELIKELVVYDGYTYIKTVTDGYFVIENYENGGKEFIFTFIDLEEYITDMNILHRLAVKVRKEMLYYADKYFKETELIDFDLFTRKNNIDKAMFTSPNEQGEHINLATALVNAIRYISANKAV